MLGLFACHPKTAPKSASKASDPVKTAKEYSAAQIAEGKLIFEAKCGKCHELKQPGEFTVASWEKILPPMSQKAKLNADDAGKVRAWVLINAKG